MGVWPWLAAGGAVIGAVVIYRRSTATPQPKEQSTCDRIAELDPTAGEACRAASAVGDLLGALELPGASTEEIEAANTALNGEVELTIPAAMPRVRGISNGNALRVTVLRYKNGCVPYRGSSGWSNCVPGTNPQNGAAAPYAAVLDGSPWDYLGDQRFTDPTTFRDDEHRGGASPTPAPFPLPVPAGSTAWWAQGQPVVCPAGTGISSSGVRDHRTGAPKCVPLKEDGADDDPIFPPPYSASDTHDADGVRYCNAGEAYRTRIDHRTSPPTRTYTPCRPRPRTSGIITATAATTDEKD